MKIGLCGTGRMGTAMAEYLMEQKHKLTVWNRTPRKASGLVKAGATRVDTPADLFDDTDMVISMLIDDKAAKAVYEGRDGILSRDLKGKLVVEMSTLMPDTTRRLEKLVKAKGGAFLECPVGGSTAPARTGNLIGMAGGTPAAYKRARPVLEQLCKRVDRVGPVGAGAAMKLAINLPLLNYFAALGEAIAITEKAGINRKLAGDILADSSGAARVAGARIPWNMAAIGGKVRKGGGFDVAGGAKDAAQMCKLAAQFGFDAPNINATRRSYQAAVADGWGERDFALLPAWRVAQSKKRKSKKKGR